MTVIATQHAGGTGFSAGHAGDVTRGPRYGFPQAVRSEWLKLRSLRSTKWTALIMLVGGLLVTFLNTNGVNKSSIFPGFDPTNDALAGLAIGSLAIGVLGVLAMSGEYGSGTIRTSLAATPRRPLFLGGKVAVVGALALVASEILTFACFFLGQFIMHFKVPANTATLGSHGVLEALLLSGAFLALLALVGMGLGVIIRHTAGAIAAYVGLTFLLSIVLQPLQNHGNPGRFGPIQMLANSVTTTVHVSHTLSPVTACLWMVFYTLVVLTVATILFVRRDA
jgi:ABC-2 type transport system permease protein